MPVAMGRSRKRALLALAASLVLTACGSEQAGPPEPVASVPGGLTTYEVDSAGFAITLPTSWIATSGGESFDQEEYDRLARDNPHLGLDGVDVEEFAFVAFAPHLRRGVGANVNVMAAAVPPGARIEDEVDRALAEIESLPYVLGPVEHEIVSLPAGKAVRLSYTADMVVSGAERRLAHVQYGVLAGDSAYLLTFTTHPAELARSEKLFARVAESLQPTG